MPRLNIEDARAVEAAIVYALDVLPQDAPQRPDWERVYGRLRLRLDIAKQGIRYQKPKYSKSDPKR